MNEYYENVDIQETPSQMTEMVSPSAQKRKKTVVKWLLAIPILLVIGAVVWFGIDLATNTYKAPVKAREKYSNAQTFEKQMNARVSCLNGFCTSEVKSILKIMKASERWEDMEDIFENNMEYKNEEYGDDWKVQIVINDKIELDEDEVEDFEDYLHATGREIRTDIRDEVRDYERDDWEDVADEMDISVSDAKKLADTMQEIGDKMRKAKVTKGYELEVTYLRDGSNMDEVYENTYTLRVYKIDGRWIDQDSVNILSGLY